MKYFGHEKSGTTVRTHTHTQTNTHTLVILYDMKYFILYIAYHDYYTPNLA